VSTIFGGAGGTLWCGVLVLKNVWKLLTAREQND
jgi:hypothetical protein